MGHKRFRSGCFRVLVAIVGFCILACCLRAQADGDPAYQAKRRKAVELFEQGRRLEALPLLEELLERNQKDQGVLVALAASLVDHAATLADPQAAAKERWRAKGLLQRSESTSPLAQNLLQLLSQLPENGAIQFSGNPAVEQAMRAGEAAFARRDFDEAITDYSRALKLEPGNYAAALFIGNTYDKKNDFARAWEWYERAIQLDPNIETAYRYCADMLAKEGEMGKARTMLIHAAVAEPYNRIVWRELKAWATINNTEINAVFVSVPVPITKSDGEASGAPVDARYSGNVANVWKAYRSVRAEWQEGGKFKKNFPRETTYRHTLAEEAEALTAAAQVLEQFRDEQTSELVKNDRALFTLLKLHRAGLMESYVLFSLGDAGTAQDYSAYRAAHRDKLEEYMDKFVVPPLQSSLKQ